MPRVAFTRHLARFVPADPLRVEGGPLREEMNIWAYIGAKTGRPMRIPAELRGAFDPGRFLSS